MTGAGVGAGAGTGAGEGEGDGAGDGVGTGAGDGDGDGGEPVGIACSAPLTHLKIEGLKQARSHDSVPLGHRTPLEQT